MQGYHYPQVVEHMKLHADMALKLKKLSIVISDPNLLVEAIPSIIKDVHSFMAEWLLQHIAVEDAKFVFFVDTL
jgi:hemerythrin